MDGGFCGFCVNFNSPLENLEPIGIWPQIILTGSIGSVKVQILSPPGNPGGLQTQRGHGTLAYASLDGV